MRYLVTGGAGFIGAALTKRLLADGHDVTALAHTSSRRLIHISPQRVVHGDVRDPACVLSAAEGCDAIAHLAYPQGRGGDPRTTMDTAARGMLNVLDACEKHGVRDLLLVSSPDVYGDAPSPVPEVTTLTVPDEFDPYCAYGGGKIASEMLAIAWLQSGALERLIIARPHNIYGPDMGTDHVIPQFCLRMNDLLDQLVPDPVPFPVRGTGQEVRSFCYISDCTDQLITLLDQGDTGIWNVGSEADHTIAYVAQRIAGYYGRKIEVRPGSALPASPPRRRPSVSKIQTLCGYRPRVSFDEGLERTVKWYQAHG